ncbi:osteocalcin 2 [Trichogramma pretiosum]|uniref:osteocalcin 2 n=1 Tax=Trichogramma pretiosum TaxID=7493 RepID=UPI000C71C5F9|nr:osteocalcin 2 [Trichogramma pretiosum]
MTSKGNNSSKRSAGSSTSSSSSSSSSSSALAKPKGQGRRRRGGSASSSGASSSSSSSDSRCSTRSCLGNVNFAIESPILGKHFDIPDLYGDVPTIELDDTLPYVPVYCHLVVPEIQPVVRPLTPPILRALRVELGEFVHTNKSTKGKIEQKSIKSNNPSRQSSKI